MEKAKSRIFPVLLGIVALLAIGGGVWWFTHGRYIEKTDNAYVAADMAVISPRVQGYIADVAVQDNQPVKKGDVLVRLVDSDYRAALARAQAEVERQARAKGVAVSGVSVETSAIAESHAALAAAEAGQRRADADARRAEDLLKQGWTTRAIVDQRRADAQTAAAVVAEKRASIASANAGRQGATGQVAGADAALKAAIAARDAAAIDLDNTVIRAPYDGIVGNRSARVGQFARTGQQMLMVVPTTEAYLVANFKETQISGLHPGMPVTIHMDAWPDAKLTGHIQSFSPASGSRFSVIPPENATGNFTRIVQRLPVRITFDRPLPDGVQLAPGLSATVEVDVRNKPDQPVVGKTAQPAATPANEAPPATPANGEQPAA